MRLNLSVVGEGPPLMLVHGLFGQGRNWGGVGKALAADDAIFAPIADKILAGLNPSRRPSF